MHLTISYEKPQRPRSTTTPKQKIAKHFLELTIAILVKFWNIQSHIFSLYLIFIGLYQFWYFSSILMIIMKTNQAPGHTY